MCRRAMCPQCGKPTWKGCGAHVEQVLGDVPAAQRCRCREAGASVGATAGATPGTRAAQPRRKWFGR